MEKKYRFEIGDILTVGLVLVVTGIALTIGLSIMTDVGSDMDPGSVAANATDDAIEGVAKLPSQMPLIATVVIAAILIGVLTRYLFVRL